MVRSTPKKKANFSLTISPVWVLNNILVLVLTIFSEGTCLAFKTVFHKAPIYFSLIVKSRSWNQPVLSNKGKVSCLKKQRNLLVYSNLF